MPDVAVTTLLERDSELQLIDEVVAEACAGSGRLAVIEGPAGIGKTRLLDALRERAGDRGMAVRAARASELDHGFPLGIVRQLFEPLVASAGRDRRASLLRGAARNAGPLLTDPAGEPAAYEAGASVAHFHALYWLVANLAEEQPVALIADDVHWADPTSLRFLEFLAPRLDGLRLLIALTARRPEAAPEAQPLDALATDARALVLRPAPLTPRATEVLIGAELGADADVQFCEACHEATGGNPFLLRELAREFATEGFRPTSETAPLVRRLAPPTVARTVLVRLGRLGDQATALARAVAVLGDGTQLRRACALAGLSGDQGSDVAAALTTADILAPARPLAFAHPILRSAVYHDLEPGERARAHRGAAALLAGDGAPADEIAPHLLATEPAEDPVVVATLREAAARARGRGASSVAVACLRRAVAEPPPLDERGGLLAELASAELHAGDPAAAAEQFDAAMRSLGDPGERAWAALEHGVALQALGRHGEAYSVRERAAEELAATDPDLALMIETTLIASASLDLSRLEWARGRLERHRTRPAAAAPGDWRLNAIRTYVDAFYGSSPADALADDAEEALASGLLVPSRTGTPSTPFYLAVEVLWLADRGTVARRALDRALDDARGRGSALAFACLSGWRCMLLARDGRLAEAEADARSCAELALAQGWFSLAPPMLGFVLHVLVARDEVDDAQRLLDSSGLSRRDPGDDLTYYPMIVSRARLRAVQGDLEGARADLALVRRRRARWNTHMTLIPAFDVAPELSCGDPREARRDANRRVDEARAWGTSRAIGVALHAAALADEGSRRLRLLHEATAALEDSPARLEYARAAIDLGAVLRSANRRSDARAPLRRALDVAVGCGAPALARRARRELRAAGGRPRSARTTGIESLTGSEQRVASMAADGLSNPEIAQALFVTKKTVETHLAGVYRKLGIRGRGQLQAILRNLGGGT